MHCFIMILTLFRYHICVLHGYDQADFGIQQTTCISGLNNLLTSLTYLKNWVHYVQETGPGES